MNAKTRILFALAIAVSFAVTACPKKERGAQQPTSTDTATSDSSMMGGPPSETPTAIESEAATAEAEISAAPDSSVPSERPVEVTSDPSGDFAMPIYEVPSAPDAKLAKFRIFWLGMNIEHWARITMGPKEDEETPVATPEAGTTPKKKPEPPIYLLMPSLVPEPGIQRFINPNPGDKSLDHITFAFFRDKLLSIEVFYRTGYFQNVILDDFIAKAKEIYGDPAQEEWRQKGVMGTIVWEDGTYNVRLSVYNGRPFALKFTDIQLRTEQAAYAEEVKKKASAKKIEEIGF